jgi:hypothetical protein
LDEKYQEVKHINVTKIGLSGTQSAVIQTERWNTAKRSIVVDAMEKSIVPVNAKKLFG